MNYDVYFSLNNELKNKVPEPKIDVCIEMNGVERNFTWEEFEEMVKGGK